MGVRRGDPAVRRALRSGAAGAVSRDDTSAALIDAVRAVAAGRRAVTACLALAPPPPVPGLSDRELEVLRLFGSGHNGRQVASTLGLSPKTVSTYRTRVLKKLGLQNGGELVRYALERGLAD
jgi:DNA-binding NarL/FixJ family response regulator